MWGNIFSSYTTTKISKKKLIWGNDEIPLTKWKSTQLLLTKFATS